MSEAEAQALYTPSPEFVSSEPHPSREEFTSLLDECFKKNEFCEGKVVKGCITNIENDFAIVDIGLKTEGRVPINEFGTPSTRGQVAIGDEVEVYVERIENILGEAVLSCDKARRESVWQDLEIAHQEKTNVEGAIVARVKGGFTVDLGGAQAFLPGSQIDVRPVADNQAVSEEVQDFQILKIDRKRNNIVVSRRAVLEESRASERGKLLGTLEEGQITDGVVKNITEYGAFVDLGGVDGLLHVTQMSWARISHPSEMLKAGDEIKVKIIRINSENQRVNLSMKHLEDDPWDVLDDKYNVGDKIKGKITNITEYGAFVEIEPGIEGLVHVSEMSWTKKNIATDKIVAIGEEVEAIILEVEKIKRRISLGIKQCQSNPWDAFLTDHPVGSKITGKIKNITDFGLFVGLTNDLDGMVHISDLSWDEDGDTVIKQFKIDQEVEVSILGVEADRERVSLGVKQISEADLSALADVKKGDVLTCTVLEAKDSGLDVEIGTSGVRSFIRRADIAKDRNQQTPERFAAKQKVDVKVVQLDLKTNRITLSIKALEVDEEKEVMKQYGSTASGASLGDVFKKTFGFGKKAESSGDASAAAEQALVDGASLGGVFKKTFGSGKKAESSGDAPAAAEQAPADKADDKDEGTS